MLRISGAKKDHQRKLRMVAYNVRAIREEQLEELEQELTASGITWDIIGLAEVRPEEKLMTLKSGHTLYHTESSNRQQGIRVLNQQ